jgi:hypothetical protein
MTNSEANPAVTAKSLERKRPDYEARRSATSVMVSKSQSSSWLVDFDRERPALNLCLNAEYFGRNFSYFFLFQQINGTLISKLDNQLFRPYTFQIINHWSYYHWTK